VETIVASLALGSPSPPLSKAEINVQCSLSFKKSKKKYTRWQRQWAEWVQQHNMNQCMDWLNSNDHLESFIVHLETKKLKDPVTHVKSDCLLYTLSTILVAVAVLNTLCTRSGWGSLYDNHMFP
jgi:hypothetical protein